LAEFETISDTVNILTMAVVRDSHVDSHFGEIRSMH